MKPGTRALGVAASGGGARATVAGAVVRATRVVDGFSFTSCAVGGLDSTAAVVDCYERLDREDVRYVLLAGIAPAWFNILDLHRIAGAADRPVCAVTFEDSEGLEPALRREFDGEALENRLETYRAQPPRTPVELGGETRYVRAVGLDDAEARDLVRAFTPEGGRPEPVRVARLAARAADAWRRETG